MDTLFAVSTAAAGILSVLAVLLAIRTGFPGTGWLIGNSMVSEGATRQMRGDGGFAAYPVPLAGDVLQIAAGYALQAGTHGSALNQDMAQAVPDGPSAQDSQDTQTDTGKVMYLTFDDGPSQENTNAVLDVLKKRNIKATFFVVGHFLETAPDLVKRMVEEGHMVGNHTYHHPDMSTISSLEAFQEELEAVADSFYEITGTRLSPYYRPPQGKANAENIKMAQQLGYSTIFWSLAYVDWDPENQPSHDTAFDKLTARIHPGAIVLLHNTSQTNGEILDELLTKWEEMGYRFVSLQQDFAPAR